MGRVRGQSWQSTECPGRLYAVAQAETKTAATQAAAVALTELIEP